MSDEGKRDSLGDRMKRQYENRTRFMLPRRTWTIIRIDGKAFSSFTWHCAKPFDAVLHAAMIHGAGRVLAEAQGAKLAYIQSDEISVVLTDFDRIETEAWFDGNIQKIASVAASLVTGGFNVAYADRAEGRVASFDARVFTIPDPVEVENYLIWRQKDAIRNSVSSHAQANFSAKKLHGKKQSDMLAMLLEIGVDFGAQPIHIQRGTVVLNHKTDINGVERSEWKPDFVSPIFTDDRDYMRRALAVTSPDR